MLQGITHNLMSLTKTCGLLDVLYTVTVISTGPVIWNNTPSEDSIQTAYPQSPTTLDANHIMISFLFYY